MEANGAETVLVLADLGDVEPACGLVAACSPRGQERERNIAEPLDLSRVHGFDGRSMGNAAPGLDHYVRSGPAQKKIVEDLYRAVLKAMSL